MHEVKNNVIQHPSREGVLKWPFLIWQLIRNIQNELAWIGRNAIACPGFTVAGLRYSPKSYKTHMPSSSGRWGNQTRLPWSM